MSYRMIVGLGNPGSDYAATRHNVGFRVLDALADSLDAEWERARRQKCDLATVSSGAMGKLLLVKPTTYMNESGVSVQKLCSLHRIPPEDVSIVYDEINLPVGEFKLSMKGSSGGHNGVASVLTVCAPRFARFRVGIGAKPDKEQPLADYVLEPFSPSDETLFLASMDRYVEGIQYFLRHGPDRAMNQINRKSKIDDSNSI